MILPPEKIQLLLDSLLAKRNKTVDDILERMNKALGGYGISPLTDESEWISHYYQNIIGLYVDMGDSYRPTLIYDTGLCVWLIETEAGYVIGKEGV